MGRSVATLTLYGKGSKFTKPHTIMQIKVKKGKSVPVNTVKAYETVDVQLHSFLITARMGVSGQLHVPAD